MLRDNTSRIAMITNMRLKQNEVVNDSAGIEAVMEVQAIETFKPVDICFFIGNIKGTRLKLGENRDKLKNFEKIEVVNRLENIREFLANKLMVSFE